MSLVETQQLLQDLLELQKKIKKEKAADRPFVVCIEGTYMAFFNLK